MMLMITPNFGYGMVVTPTTKYMSISPSLSHLFFCDLMLELQVMMHSLCKSGSWVGVKVLWHTKM